MFFFHRIRQIFSSLVIKDLVYEAKAKDMKIFQGQGQDFFLKAKAKDIKIFQGQHQGQLKQLPLRAKICINVKSTTKGG